MDYLMGKLYMKTKIINIFDSTPRRIKCIENEFDYLGDGTIFTEEKLAVGELYTLVKIEIKPYGKMIYLQEIESECGFHDFLFEELKEYDLGEYKRNYRKWIDEMIKGR